MSRFWERGNAIIKLTERVVFLDTILFYKIRIFKKKMRDYEGGK